MVHVHARRYSATYLDEHQPQISFSFVADPLTYVRWALLLQEQLVVSHAERERLLQEVARMQHEVASLRQAIAAREQEIAATLREAERATEAAAAAVAQLRGRAPTAWAERLSDCLLYTSPSPRDA